MKLSKLYKKIFLLSGICLFLSGCNLDEDPRDQMPGGSYSSPKQAEQAVIGAYSNLRNWANNIYLHMSECRSDNTWVDPVPNGLREYSEIGTFRADFTLSTFNGTWADLYKVVNASNLVIESLPNITFPKDETNPVKLKDQLEGEVHFLRGWAYFELARLFGNVPLIDRTMSPAETKTVKQSTAAELYEKIIIPDLKLAESKLPVAEKMITSSYATATSQGRADQIAAKAMLARVYMTMAGFPLKDVSAEALAETKLKEVLDYADGNGKYWAPTAEEWQKQWLTEYNNKYSIFAIQYRSGGTGNSAIFNFSPALPPSYTSIRIYGNSIFVEKSLKYEFDKVYSNGTRDIRGDGATVLDGFDAEPNFPAYSNTKETLEVPGVGEVEVYTKSFFYKYLNSLRKRQNLGYTGNFESEMKDYNDWAVNYPVIRLEDIMLMYAEVLLNKHGDISGAMSYVNKIRQRAGCDAVTAATATDAMKAVKQERRIEFAGEGIRWFDMIRYGEWEKNIKDKLSRYNNPVGTSESYIKPGRYLYPIPQTEMIGFPGLYNQNADY